MRTTAAFLATLLIATACSQAPEPPPPPATPSAPAKPVAQTPPAPSRATPAANVPINPKVVFASEPATIRRCETDNGKASVTLKWNALGAGSKSVRVLVGERPFTNRAARGSATTGLWVRQQTEFTLVDGDSGQVLAKLRVPFVDC